MDIMIKCLGKVCRVIYKLLMAMRDGPEDNIDDVEIDRLSYKE